MPCKNHPLVEDRLTRCAVCTDAFCPDCVVAIGGLPYCMDCKTEMLLDLLSGVPPMSLDMASILRRFMALLVDGLVLGLPLILIILLALVALGGSQAFADPTAEISPVLPMLTGVATLLWTVLVVVYEALMLAARGQTVGKKALGIKVVTADGAPISRRQAWGRTLIRHLFGMTSCLGLLDYLVALGSERTCIHDILAKTRVVNWND